MVGFVKKLNSINLQSIDSNISKYLLHSPNKN